MAKTILAVDDSSSLRQMVAFSLKAAGYQVVEAVDGQDGLDKAKQQTVDLVLTDQNMPRMDGLALIKMLRALPAIRSPKRWTDRMAWTRRSPPCSTWC